MCISACYYERKYFFYGVKENTLSVDIGNDAFIVVLMLEFWGQNDKLEAFSGMH